MSTHEQPHMPRSQILAGIFLLLVGIASKASCTMTVSGPITASSVTVTGSVTMSSVTVSSLTVSNLLSVTGKTTGISGRILQIVAVSTNSPTSTTSTSWQNVVGANATIALSSPSNYILISLTGNLYEMSGSTASVTIIRDGTVNLGDTNSGLATVHQGNTLMAPANITVLDTPGDTTSHTYGAWLKSDGSNVVEFPHDDGIAFLILEEVSQ